MNIFRTSDNKMLDLGGILQLPRRPWTLDDFDYILRLEAENASRHLISVNGDAALDGNGGCVFDGVSGHVSFDMAAFGTDKCVFQGYVYINSSDSGASAIFDMGVGLTLQWNFYYPANEVSVVINSVNHWFTYIPPRDTYIHMALVRHDATNWSIYAEGNRIGQFTDSYSLPADDAYIGDADNSGFNSPLDGKVSRFVIQKGTDNGWTGATITPPARTAAITVDSYTVLALDFAGTAASTRIIDLAKPSYLIDASDDFSTESFNTRRWSSQIINEPATTTIVDNTLRYDCDNSSGSESGIQSFIDVPLAGDFTIIVNNIITSHGSDGAYTDGVQIGLVGGTANNLGKRKQNGVIEFTGRIAGGATIEVTTASNNFSLKMFRVGTTLTQQYNTGSGWTTIASGTDNNVFTGINLYGYNAHAGASIPTYYTFDSIEILDGDGDTIQINTDTGETSILPDVSNNEYDVENSTVLEQPSYDAIDNSLVFDGGDRLVDGVIDLASSNFVIFLTLETTNNVGGTPLTIDSSSSHDIANYAIDFYTSAGAIQANFSNGTAQTLLTYTGTYADGQPHLLELVRNGTDLELYFDGVLADSGTVSGSMNSGQTLNIGSRFGGSDYYTGDFFVAMIRDTIKKRQIIESLLINKYGI